MDFSNFNSEHKNFSNSNKAQIGFFKNELGGKYTCLEFVGLRAKCYSLNLMNIKDESISEKKMCKGLGRVAIQNKLKFKHYKDSLFNRKIYRFDYNSIRSVKQNVSTIRLKKKLFLILIQKDGYLIVVFIQSLTVLILLSVITTSARSVKLLKYKDNNASQK
jgi:hypothetical protein